MSTTRVRRRLRSGALLCWVAIAATVTSAQGGGQPGTLRVKAPARAAKSVRQPSSDSLREGPAPNLLLIIADDLGVDRVAAYDEHPQAGPTPVIDALADHGVLFRNAWSSPVCSSARAALLTGRHGYRTGVTTSLNYQTADLELGLDELTIPEALPARYQSAAIGKWHLTSVTRSGPLHPLLSGFDHHAGTIDSFGNGESPEIYYAFEKVVDGVPEAVSTYATTDTVDDALAWIGEQTRPWFCWLSFNAPHIPFHAPPDELTTLELPAIDPDEDGPLFMRAATEAMDAEIGRLLSSLPQEVLSRTTIVFVGDNGTAPKATTAPFKPSAAKGKVLEGGVNVPLIVAGHGVHAAGRESAALVHVTDLLPTFLELAGVQSLPESDGLSLVPFLSAPELPSRHPWVFTERRKPNGFGPYTEVALAVRGERYKLVYNDPPLTEGQAYRLFDLLSDPLELDDLLASPQPPGGLTDEQKVARARLERVLLNQL